MCGVCLFVWFRTTGRRQNDMETKRQNDIDTERKTKGTSRGEMGPSRAHLVVWCDQVGHIAL